MIYLALNLIDFHIKLYKTPCFSKRFNQKMANIKGHDINIVVCKDSFDRRSIQYMNKIFYSLKKIGLSENYVDVPLEKVAMKKTSASATWYIKGNKLHFSYQAAGRFVDNLFVVSKVIELEVEEIINQEKTINDFISAFSEEGDVEKERKEARETLGIEHDTMDIEAVNKQYKALAKESHPDMPNGDHEKFKAINRAHKILKRELE